MLSNSLLTGLSKNTWGHKSAWIGAMHNPWAGGQAATAEVNMHKSYIETWGALTHCKKVKLHQKKKNPLGIAEWTLWNYVLVVCWIHTLQSQLNPTEHLAFSCQALPSPLVGTLHRDQVHVM